MRRDDSSLRDFLRLVVACEASAVRSRLHAHPTLATGAAIHGATRGQPSAFLPEVQHYLYAGDTPLHLAAAAHSREMAELLVRHGADPRAKNRRGAEPLHYAADTPGPDPEAQAGVIAFLLSAGANPDAVDRSGVAPLHRAVRSRSLAAVRALLDGGADPRRPNKSGSSPLHLAVQTTGKSGSGSEEARIRQAGIIRLLLERGARATDPGTGAKSVLEAASSEWVRRLLVGE